MFLTIKWLDKIFNLFLRQRGFFIRDKEIQFTPKLFLATLLRMYELSLWEKILERYFQELTPEEKSLCEKGFDYLYAQDLFSLEFSSWYQEMLLGRDYKGETYKALAYEFLTLKEQIREQIQIPLLDRVKKLALDLEELLEKGKSPEEEKLHKLIRLYTFFYWVKTFKPSKIEELVGRAEVLLKQLSIPLEETTQDNYSEIKPLLENKFMEELQNFIKSTKIKVSSI